MKIISILLMFLSVSTYGQESKEKAPEFRGGILSLKAFIAENYEYPKYETKEGTVIVEFRLASYGYIYDIKIIKGLSEPIDESVIQLIDNMPSWNSARNKYGKRIEAFVTLPIKVEKSLPEITEVEEVAVDDWFVEDGSFIPNRTIKDDSTKVYDVVAIDPEFIGGEKAMTKFIADNFIYPDSARINEEQGVVYVQFVVSKKGNVEDVKVLRGVSKSIDKEAIRIISIMPKWRPGEQAGKPVNVRYVLPIRASLD